jgi:hypothetical protein
MLIKLQNSASFNIINMYSGVMNFHSDPQVSQKCQGYWGYEAPGGGAIIATGAITGAVLAKTLIGCVREAVF